MKKGFGLIATATVLLACIWATVGAGSVTAGTSCAPVTKSVYVVPWKVDVRTRGPVGCGLARTLIRRTIQPMGFNGTVKGFRCRSPFGIHAAAVYLVTCRSEGPRRVVKSVNPRRA